MTKKKISILVGSMLISLSAIGSVTETPSTESPSTRLIDFIHEKSEGVISKEKDNTLQISDYADAISQSTSQMLNIIKQDNDAPKQNLVLTDDNAFTPGVNKKNCHDWYSNIMAQAGAALKSSQGLATEQSVGLVALLNLGALGGFLCPSFTDETESQVIPWSANLLMILAGQDLLAYFNPNPPFKMVQPNQQLGLEQLSIEKPKLKADDNLFMKEILELSSNIDKDKSQGKVTQEKLAGYATTALTKFVSLYALPTNSISKSEMLGAVDRDNCAQNYQNIIQWATDSLTYTYSADKPMTTVQLLAFMVALNAGSIGGSFCPTKDEGTTGEWVDKIPWSVNQSMLTVLNATLYNLSPVNN